MHSDLRQYRSDLRACRAALSDGSRTFLAASHLLPGEVRDAACALYAFCRLADDAIDLGSSKAGALDALRHRLERIYAGLPAPIPADRALARVVADYDIPKALPEALLDGFAWDAEYRTYPDFEALLAYAARVAGSVGAMMALLMRRRDASELALACDLGMAMQLTNIARDVGEDARAGRLYLPLDWLDEAGLDATSLLSEVRASEPLSQVVARLLREADVLYARADAGIVLLPAGCRPAIRLARVLYAAIGDEVRRRGCDSVSSRATISAARKLGLAPRAWMGSKAIPGPFLARPAAQFLVAAVAPHGRPHDHSRAGPRRGIEAHIHWLFDLYAELEWRDRAASPVRDVLP